MPRITPESQDWHRRNAALLRRQAQNQYLTLCLLPLRKLWQGLAAQFTRHRSSQPATTEESSCRF